MEWFEIYLLGLFPSLIMAISLFNNDIRCGCGFDGNLKRRVIFVAMCLGSFVTLIFVCFALVYAVASHLIEGHNRKQRGL